MASIISKVVERYHDSYTPLHVRGEPWKVAIGCILSQRTRDEVTDSAFSRLLSRYPTLDELAKAEPGEVEKLIYPVGFYRQKAKRIVEAARYMLENGVGRTLEDIMRIPGVGRKCANIVLTSMGIPAIAVDTHVFRVVRRVFGVQGKEKDVEDFLKNSLPEGMWNYVNRSLVVFGREICKPIKPRCGECPIKEWCVYYRDVARGQGDKRSR